MVFCESPSLTLYDVFRINSWCSMYQYFIPFYWRILLRGKDIPHFHYAFISWYTIEIFPLWAIMNNSVMNIHVLVFAWTNLFIISYEYILRSKIPGSYGNFMFHIFEKLPGCFSMALQHFIFPLPVWEAPNSSILYNSCYYLNF